jgi:curved DNA-binding protein CbpA
MPGRNHNPKDYYATLGVPPGATDEDLRSAYRRLALQWHPDRNKVDPSATERFQEISEAYAALTDPAKRREYDALRAAHAEPSFRYSREDLFRDMFANRNASAVFEELAREFERMGMRVDRHYFEQALFAGRVLVTGGVFVISPLTPILGMFSLAKTALRAMGGVTALTGKTAPSLPGVSGLLSGIGKFGRWLVGLPAEPATGSPVPTKGDMTVPLSLSRTECEQGTRKEIVVRRDGSDERLLVTVPAGVRAGSRLRLKGKGTSGPDGTAGDLYLSVVCSN